MSNVSTTTEAIYQAVIDSLNNSGNCGVLPPAPPGKSAYEVAVVNGFVGSEKQWLDSLTLEQEKEIARLEARIVAAEKFTKDSKYAASRLVGESTRNVMQVGAFGLGVNKGVHLTDFEDEIESTAFFSYALDTPNAPSIQHGMGINLQYNSTNLLRIFGETTAGDPKLYFQGKTSGGWKPINMVYHDNNTTLDGNGALKPSSPVLRVFNNCIEGNHDGDAMAATYTKNGVGDYTIRGTTGLRTDGWYVVIPNDMNGNPKVAITLDDTDGVITLKTYVRIFDMSTFKFVPDLEQPLDIPDGRWIDLRFNDLPQEELVEPEPR